MGNIKNFNSFINEELDTQTYKNAAEKLKKIGHSNRSKELSDYADNKKNSVEPIDVELYGEKYHLTSDNIRFDKTGDYTGGVEILIDLNPTVTSLADSGDLGGLWNKLTDKQKTDFNSEYKSMGDVESGELFSIEEEFSDFSEDKKDFFSEWVSMVLSSIIVIGANLNKYSPSMQIDSYECQGLNIPDRRTAVKIYKFIKEWVKLSGADVVKCFGNLKVNDLYNN